MSEQAAPLTSSRCFNHPLREAAALCRDCQRFFCRECVTEHDGRLLCASCLRAHDDAKSGGRSLIASSFRIVHAMSGMFIAWMAFYLVAQMLLSIPAEFHDGTVWEMIF